ncbi:cytidine deaminase [Kineococcus sp. SYSU DK003]|uniref:cytidine deaminase n=1 Tax=Kineococcus sp. SYSU DK003 TaxID=3383124 RepID=UPI003D7F1681
MPERAHDRDGHPTLAAPPDFDVLRAAAREALQHSYSPYSKFPVGAAALVDDGRVVSGANIENASYGVTLCAECTMVGQLQMTGGGRLVAFACVDAAGNVLMPCGRCRQLLFEFGGPDLLVDSPRGIVPMTQVLPDAFGPHDLDDPARKVPE